MMAMTNIRSGAIPVRADKMAEAPTSSGRLAIPALCMGMSHSIPVSTLDDHNDAVATQLATKTLSGEVTESRARWEMASLLVGSSLVDQAARHHSARRWYHSGQQDTADIAAIIQSILVTKVAGHNPSLDLQMIASGRSFSGWARRFATSFEMGATVHRTLSHVPTPVEQETLEDACPDTTAPITSTKTDDEQARSVADGIVDGFAAAAHNTMEGDLPVLQATALAAYYEVPLPVRGVRLPAYLQLRRRLDAGGQHIVIADIADTLEDPESGPVGLAVLWGQTVDVPLLTRLCELPPIVVQAFATHSLTPLAPPPVEDLRQLLDDAIAAVGCAPTSKMIRKLVRAWVGTYAELNVRHRNQHVTRPRLLTKAERRTNQQTWTDLVTRLLDEGLGRELGDTPDSVAEWLEHDLARIRIRQPHAA